MAFDLTEVTAQLKNATDLLYTIRTAGRGDFKTKAAAIEQRANLGDFGPSLTAVGRTGLVGIGSAYENELNRQLAPVFNNILRLAGEPAAADPRAAGPWSNIIRYLVAQTRTFKARGAGLASFPGGLTTSGKGAASAIVGDGSLKRLIVDRYGYSLDAANGAATFTVRCVKDATNGAKKYAEEFEYFSDESLTIFDRGGVGERGRIILPNGGGNILKNASFKFGNAADTDPTVLGKWLDDAGITGNYDISTTGYRAAPEEQGGDNIKLGLEFIGNSALYQVIDVPLKRGVPYLYGGSFYRKTNCDRLVTVKLGTKTGISFQIDTQTNATWVQRFATIGVDLYLDNFLPVDGSTDLKLTITTAIGTGANAGTVIADNMFLIEGTPINGTWVWFVPATLAHAIDDQLVWTDTAPATLGKIATVVQEWSGRHLPTAGSPTITDP